MNLKDKLAALDEPELRLLSLLADMQPLLHGLTTAYTYAELAVLGDEAAAAYTARLDDAPKPDEPDPDPTEPNQPTETIITGERWRVVARNGVYVRISPTIHSYSVAQHEFGAVVDLKPDWSRQQDGYIWRERVNGGYMAVQGLSGWKLLERV